MGEVKVGDLVVNDDGIKASVVEVTETEIKIKHNSLKNLLRCCHTEEQARKLYNTEPTLPLDGFWEHWTIKN